MPIPVQIYMGDTERCKLRLGLYPNPSSFHFDGNKVLGLFLELIVSSKVY